MLYKHGTVVFGNTYMYLVIQGFFISMRQNSVIINLKKFPLPYMEDDVYVEYEDD